MGINWQKIVDTEDLIIFEKDYKTFKSKIEARLNEDKKWEVYHTRIKRNSSALISKNTLQSKKEARILINELIKKRAAGKIGPAETKISLNRIFKEAYVEKWKLTVNNYGYENIIFLLYLDKISADIILHEDLKPIEEQIIAQIEENLGLLELMEIIDYKIYYFSSKREETKDQGIFDAKFLLDNMEFRFDEE